MHLKVKQLFPFIHKLSNKMCVCPDVVHWIFLNTMGFFLVNLCTVHLFKSVKLKNIIPWLQFYTKRLKLCRFKTWMLHSWTIQCDKSHPQRRSSSVFNGSGIVPKNDTSSNSWKSQGILLLVRENFNIVAIQVMRCAVCHNIWGRLQESTFTEWWVIIHHNAGEVWTIQVDGEVWSALMLNAGYNDDSNAD